MSIHYAVASAPSAGNGRTKRVISSSTIRRCSRWRQGVTVEAGDDFTAAFPAKQGAEVTVRLKDGRVLSHRLQDVIPADLDLIRRRFRDAAAKTIGAHAAKTLEARG